MIQRRRTNPVDALSLLVKTSMTERKRRPPYRILAVVAALALVMAAGVWWFWSWPGPPRVDLTAYDQVAGPDETVPLQARLEPIEVDRAGADLSKNDLYFQGGPIQTPLRARTASDGSASVEASFPASDVPVPLLVGFPGEPGRQRGAHDEQAHVFVWKSDRRLLLVDVDHLLPSQSVENLWTRNSMDVRIRPEAAAALRQIARKYRIVCLSAGTLRPEDYKKLRSWLKRELAANDPFPIGPLLAPGSWPGLGEGPSFYEGVAARLKERFQEPIRALSGRPESASVLRAVGLATYLLGGQGAMPEGVTPVKSWKDLEKALE